ncbi:MAG: hypothetical protein A2W33_03445 [Chloroflexi bacterium RBG_16_52_11]|nr:MAG: hypothetical protein A2W33_03445 [Chloroflexi bacterium RBG_16_52_11]
MSISLVKTRSHTSHFFGDWLAHHWLEIFLIVYGLWVWLPFLAPVLMNMGWSGAGKAIYFIYSFFCHQLPERSIFLFGEKPMYTLAEIQAAWQNTINPLTLRKFIGNETLGWKVAWSDRMISFYTSIWLFALIWPWSRRKVKPLPLWGFVLFLLPIALDGGTHMISDLAGIGQGFRDSNQWLAALTNNALPALFYAGDALGSFNSWMRLFTGLLAGLGIVWFAFPLIFQMDALRSNLDELNYGEVLEQIKRKNPHTSG